MTDPHIHREFLGWDQPCLPAAATNLVDRFLDKTCQTLKLSQVIIVVPGQRAGRRLLELLVEKATSSKLIFTPPDIITESALPERLYKPEKPFASPLIGRLAWAKAIQDLTDQLQPVVPNPPKPDENLKWIRLGERIGQVLSELDADGINEETFLTKARSVSGDSGHSRWNAFSRARDAYRQTLSDLTLCDRNVARVEAVDNCRLTCGSSTQIVLVGMVDLNSVVKRMLKLIARNVTAFVFAPPKHADKFDECGCLRPESWTTFPVPIRDEQIHYAENPLGQAAAVVSWLASLDGHYAIDQIVVGIPDAAVVPPLRRHLKSKEIRVRWLEGHTLADTAPYQLLATAADYATGRRYEDFAALVRHPDLDTWLRNEKTAVDLTELDRFFNLHLPAQIDEYSMDETVEIPSVVRHVGGWLKAALNPMRLSQWKDGFSDILKTVYVSYRTFDLGQHSDRVRHAALEQMLDLLESLRSVPPELDRVLTAADAFAVIFEEAARTTIPPSADPDAIELLGWLELPLDDAPATMVTTFNEGSIPSSAGADPFLPDELRRRLRIENNIRRYARDAYATTVLAHSKEKFACVVARRDSEKNPLAPSRLFFTGPESELIARAEQWARGVGTVASLETPGTDRSSPFRLPEPTCPDLKGKTFHVTEFRTYLACKYRYYLRHIQKLNALSDDVRELDGSTFGTLLHKVLQDWGQDLHGRNSCNASKLAANLKQRLKEQANRRFRNARPAIQLQLAQAGRRLEKFAQYQAQLIAEGWKIVYTENDESLQTQFDTRSGKTVILKGRIDRIDYHAEKNLVRIIDYKTADKALTPDKTHRRHNRWIDLQLPLYRHLWRAHVPTVLVPDNATVELAYFQIPKALDTVEVALAKWNDDILSEADKTAREVIEGVLQGKFGPPTIPAPDHFDDYAAICMMDERYEQPFSGEDEEGIE